MYSDFITCLLCIDWGVCDRVRISCFNSFHSFFSQVITSEMKSFLLELKKKVVIGIVGGSDKGKQEEQMGGDGRHEYQLLNR